MDSQNMISFLVYIGIGVICYACLKEFVHNLLTMNAWKKAVVHNDKTQISIIMITYIVCLYVQTLIGLLPMFVNLPHFIFYTWLDHVVYYFFTSRGLFWLGIINLANAVILYAGKKVQEIKKIWIILKVAMLPFYLLNGIHYLYAIEAPEEGDWLYVLSIMILLGLVPVMLFIFPCVLNFLNGCIGWNYIHYLQGQDEGEKGPSKIHYVLQSLPVLDLISMAVLLKRYKGSGEIEERITAERITPEESKAEAKKRKKKKMIDAAVVSLIILLSAVIHFPPQTERPDSLEPTICEMTEEEKKLLKDLYSEIARYEMIEEGKLFETQVKELEIIRFALKSVEERYPETQFSIYSARNEMDCYEFNVKEESSGSYFEMYVYDGEKMTVQDNLYVYFLKEKWEVYLEEKLREKIDGIVKVECSKWKVVDTERYKDLSDISIETILKNGSGLAPGEVEISISAKGKSEEECRGREEELEETIHGFQLPMEFWIKFFDETEEEILSEGREKKEICGLWIWQE